MRQIVKAMDGGKYPYILGCYVRILEQFLGLVLYCIGCHLLHVA